MASAHNGSGALRQFFQGLAGLMGKAEAGGRSLRLRDDGVAHVPFPYDAHFLANLREDQKPRFYGAITSPDDLPEVTLKIADLIATQDRIDPAKAEAMAEAPEGSGAGKPPVVVTIDGKHYVADGHHRAAAAWLKGEESIRVRHKDLTEVSQALKSVRVTLPGARIAIIKADHEQRMVYAWASVISENGEPVVDSQGHIIEAHELEKAAAAFMEECRFMTLEHERNQDGSFSSDLSKADVIHSFPLTADIAKAFGIKCDREGWLIGYRLNDDDLWEQTKSGKLGGLSIGGWVERLEEAA